MKVSPIALFTYKKVGPLKQTITALQKNSLAIQSPLYIFSDGAKNEQDRKEVQEVRTFLKGISGFKKVVIREAEENKGLANSIINGVSQILENYDTVIVLEDDLISSTNFLDYMNQGLAMYAKESKVQSIAGYSFPLRMPTDYNYDSYFLKRGSSWGWATWKERWTPIDWSVSDYPDFAKDKEAQTKFNKMGSDLSQMLSKQMQGKINSWAIRWCYHQFKHNLYSVHPTVSKISNIGFDAGATHTQGAESRYRTVLDSSDKKEFHFNPNIALNTSLTRQFVRRFSIPTRIYYKIKNMLKV